MKNIGQPIKIKTENFLRDKQVHIIMNLSNLVGRKIRNRKNVIVSLLLILGLLVNLSYIKGFENKKDAEIEIKEIILKNNPRIVMIINNRTLNNHTYHLDIVNEGCMFEKIQEKIEVSKNTKKDVILKIQKDSLKNLISMSINLKLNNDILDSINLIGNKLIFFEELGDRERNSILKISSFKIVLNVFNPTLETQAYTVKVFGDKFQTKEKSLSINSGENQTFSLDNIIPTLSGKGVLFISFLQNGEVLLSKSYESEINVSKPPNAFENPKSRLLISIIKVTILEAILIGIFILIIFVKGGRSQWLRK